MICIQMLIFQIFETNLREIENYIHPTILEDIGIRFEKEYLDNWNKLDIGEYCARYSYENNPDSTKPWSEVTDKKKSEKIGRFKKQINMEYSKKLTKCMLEEMEVFDEVKEWFNSIKEFAK